MWGSLRLAPIKYILRIGNALVGGEITQVYTLIVLEIRIYGIIIYDYLYRSRVCANESHAVFHRSVVCAVKT